MKWRTGALVAVALAAAVTIPALAHGKVTAFSDARAVTLGDPFEHPYCPPVQNGAVPTAAAAIRDLERFLRGRAGARAVRGFAHSKSARTAGRARGAAAAAVLAHAPPAALAALLRAHALRPRDALTLLDASAVAADLGMPRDALALADAGARLELPRRTPLGISARALAANARGAALAELGRYRDAERALRAAVARDDFLADAKLSLAGVLACEKKKDEAARYYRLGSRHQKYDEVQSTPPAGPEQPGATRPPVTETYDLSGGVDVKLPTIRYPLTPAEGVAMADQFRALSGEYLARIQAGNAKQAELATHLKPASAFARRRVNGIRAAIGTLASDPSLRPLSEAANRARYAANALWADYFTGSPAQIGKEFSEHPCDSPDTADPCKAWHEFCRDRFTGIHHRWLAAQAQLDTAERTYAKAWYRTATGLAANIKDPVQHAITMVAIKSTLDGFYYDDLVGTAGSMTFSEKLWEDCATTAPSPGGAEDGTPEGEDSKPCPPSVEGLEFALELELVTFTINCEEIGVELETEGWLGLFVRATGEFESGSLTVFAGPRAGVRLTPVPGVEAGPVLGGTVRDGLYIKVGAEGIEDAGARYEHYSTVGMGRSVVYRGDSMDFSFVGIFGGASGP